MSGPMPFELTDAAIERMLVKRAGQRAPTGFVPAIMEVVDRTPQPRRGGLPVLRLPNRDVDRLLLVAAVVALIAVAIALAVIGGQLFRSPDRLVVVPIVSPSSTPAQALPTATPEPTPTPVPFASPTATILGTEGTPVANGPLIVYAIVKDHVEVFTLDPATGRRVPLGTLQNRSGPAGQSIHWSNDRAHAIVFASSDSVLASVDVRAKVVEPLRLPVNGNRDFVSPSGTKIARLDESGPTQGQYVVSVVDLDGDEIARSAEMPDGTNASLGGTWSPDERSVILNSCQPCETGTPNSHLFRVPLDGSRISVIADTSSSYMGWATFSPDGTMIAFSDAECGGSSCTNWIGLVRVSDGQVTRLTTDGGESPAWSPDGRSIAYTVGASEAAGVYVVAIAGGAPRRLTTAGSSVTDGDRDATWSPDGSFIEFSRGPYDNSMGDVYVVASTGGKPRLLVKNAVADW